MYLRDKRFIIKSAGTRSVIEELESIIVRRHPNLKFELKEVHGFDDGWCLLKYNAIPKDTQYYMAGVPYSNLEYFGYKNTDNSWCVVEV